MIYDALIDAQLQLVSPGCLKLDVGKPGGQPSTSQAQINRLLVAHCLEGKQVHKSDLSHSQKCGCSFKVRLCSP